MWYVVGLGNPGDEYVETRHNAGRMVLDAFLTKTKLPKWEENTKQQARTSEGKIGKESLLLLEPETYMNKSGGSVKSLVTSAQKAEHLVVVHDDIDLPLGTLKITFGRGSGGHRGVESVIRAIRTKNFTRVRIGVTPTTPGGKLKKPQGEEKTLSFIVGKFKPQEHALFKKAQKKAVNALETIITEGRMRAMNEFN